MPFNFTQLTIVERKSGKVSRKSLCNELTENLILKVWKIEIVFDLSIL